MRNLVLRDISFGGLSMGALFTIGATKFLLYTSAVPAVDQLILSSIPRIVFAAAVQLSETINHINNVYLIGMCCM